MFRVLVVDDESSIRQLVEYTLTQSGYETITAESAIGIVSVVREKKPDLIILDIMLPGKSGHEACQDLRRAGISTPIIMLTARDDEIDTVLGLEMGADDYMTKPFSPRELAARVRAVLRRTTTTESVVDSVTQDDGVIRIGNIEVDVNNYEVKVNHQQADLTTREFELLAHLCKNVNRVLSRDQLLERIWGYEFAGDTRIVDVHISHLREKLEVNPKSPQYIKTVRGVGYKMVKGEAQRGSNP